MTATIFTFPAPPAEELEPAPRDRDAEALARALFATFNGWLETVDEPTYATVVAGGVDFALQASETGVASRRVSLSNLSDRMRPPAADE